MPAPKAPVVAWVNAFDAYAYAVYQGELNQDYATFFRKDIYEGNNAISWSTSTPDGKSYPLKFTAVRKPAVSAHFTLVNGEEYMSGMPVDMAYAAKEGITVQMVIDTNTDVSAVNYEVSGADVPGGLVTQKGAAKLTKPTPENPLRWIAEFTIANLPVRVNKITATIKAGTSEQIITGSIKLMTLVCVLWLTL